jgi:hypothetical protein
MKIFILVFSLLIAFICFWYGIKLIKLWLQVRNWQRTGALINKKSIVKKTLSSGSRAPYKLSIEYTYMFDLRNYTGNKVFLIELLKGEKGYFFKDAQKALDKIKSEADVYVNPHNPEESVMFCDGIIMYVLIILMGFVSLFVGAANYFG